MTTYVQFSSFGDFTLLNNTFSDMTYLEIEDRQFLRVYPSPSCNPASRVQHISVEGNKFVNLQDSYLEFVIDYKAQQQVGDRSFSIKNNNYENLKINRALLQLTV